MTCREGGGGLSDEVKGNRLMHFLSMLLHLRSVQQLKEPQFSHFSEKKGVKRGEERVLMDQWQDFLILLCSAAHSQLCTKKKSKIAGDHRNSKWSVKVGLLTRFSLIFLFWRGFYWHFATTRLVSFHVSPHASLDIKRLVTFSSFLLLLPVVLYISSSTDCPVGTCHFTFSSIRRDDIVGGLDVSARNNGQPTSSVFFPLCQ